MFTYLPTSEGFVVSDFGSFGRQPFGNPASSTTAEGFWEVVGRTYQHSPLKFKCESGQEGPQVVLSWESPTRQIARLMIRRKLGEYPRDPEDGVLVLDDSSTPNERTSYVDSTLSRLLRAVKLAGARYGVGTIAPESDVNMLPGVSVADRGAAASKVIEVINSVFKSTLTSAGLSSTGTTLMRQIARLVQDGDLTESNTPGDSRWWYYRIFTLPNQPELSEQFSGLGRQKLTDSSDQAVTLRTVQIDVQEYRNLEVTLLNRSPGAVTFKVYSCPTSEDAVAGTNAVEIYSVQVGASAHIGVFLHDTLTLEDQSNKYLYVSAAGGGADSLVSTEVLFTATRPIFWQSNSYLSKPCLAYVTGRHLDLIWRNNLLPVMYTQESQNLDAAHMQTLEVALTPQGWVNLNEESTPRGPLYRFLKLMTLELDRDHAYYEATLKYDHDINHAPEQVLKHIAFSLGWQVDTSGNLMDVREEIFRVAGLYKNKTTPDLVESVVSQTLDILPRVQEGGGLVLRVADPSLFPKESS